MQYLLVYADNFSICCFLEQSATEAWGEVRAVSRTQLGFHDWEAGPDYARLGSECAGVGGLVKVKTRGIQVRSQKVWLNICVVTTITKKK